MYSYIFQNTDEYIDSYSETNALLSINWSLKS